MQYEKSKADPCLYFKWKRKGLVIWMSWVDDLFVTGNTEDVHFEKNEMMMRFDNARAIDFAIVAMVRSGDFEHQESRKILYRKFGHNQ